MLIRPAMLADLNACYALDADSQTDHVWQMEERKENGSVVVRFQLVRLPRVMRVAYPRRREDLFLCWENGATVLVASDRPAEEGTDLTVLPEDADPAHVYGYCQLDPHPWQQSCWLSHLIVDRRLRRRGIGSAMLQASIEWGRQNGLRRLMIAVQTKNYPGISFCEKHRFTFCGFNDHYFPNRDIALFFARKM